MEHTDTPDYDNPQMTPEFAAEIIASVERGDRMPQVTRDLLARYPLSLRTH